MTIDPIDFSGVVVAPYLATVVLMLRRHFRKDGSGNRNAPEDPFAQTAFYLAAAALAVAMVFMTLRFFHVIIPYGSLWFGAVGLIWMGHAIWLQRRAPPPPVRSRDLRPVRKDKPAAGARKANKPGSARSPAP